MFWLTISKPKSFNRGFVKCQLFVYISNVENYTKKKSVTFTSNTLQTKPKTMNYVSRPT